MPKILVVEDDSNNLDMLVRRLQRQDFDVHYARDGKSALQQIRDLVPDVVLMDIGLPVMDGWEVTRIVKSEDAIKHIPIIALTAFATRDDVQRSIDAGCDRYLEKPVKFEQLLETIQELLEEN